MQILNNSKIKNDPFYKEWRLVGAYVFFIICLYDFVFAPISLVLYSIYTKTAYVAWVPLTTQGGGLFYLAYGGILGISAWGKFSENRDMLKFTADNNDDTNNPPNGDEKKGT